MTFDGTNNGEAAQALQEKVLAQKDKGYAVISPGGSLSSGAYAVTVDSGDLNASDTLSVGASSDEALFNGSTVSLSGSTNIGIGGVNTGAQGNEQYRYDVLWIDSNGEVNKTEGTVGTLAPAEDDNNLTRFERFSNPIPTPETYPSTVVAVVIVNSSDSNINTDNLRDYRVPAGVSTYSLSGPLTSDSSLTNIAGEGLGIVSNTLQAALGDGLGFASGNIQILDSIWDAANNELTADVNNTNTTTNTLEADQADTRSGYVDVTTARAFGTTETNNTGSDLDVRVVVQASADATQTNFQMIVDGVTVDLFARALDTLNFSSVAGTVPNGSDYKVGTFGSSADTADYQITSWVEQQ